MSFSVSSSPKPRYWVRIAIAIWMTAVIIGAFLLPIPRINILEHTARHLYFHVPMWFAMMAAFFLSAFYSIRVLSKNRQIDDIRASQAAMVGMFFGIFGVATGIVWSRFTWYTGSGRWWNNDPKQVMAVVQILIYAAYFVLRSSFDEPERRGKVAAVYNLFSAASIPFLLFVVPRQMQSLHPGAEGNPAFDEITHPLMRAVFYPAVIGFIAIFWWMYTQRVRLERLRVVVEGDLWEGERDSGEQ
jgi:heme exporter protein C